MPFKRNTEISSEADDDGVAEEGGGGGEEAAAAEGVVSAIKIVQSAACVFVARVVTDRRSSASGEFNIKIAPGLCYDDVVSCHTSSPDVFTWTMR